MAEAVVLAGVGWVVSPIITKVLNEGFGYLGETNIKDRLNNLETTILPKFQLVIEAAEKTTEHKTKMGQWLTTLKDALCEAEDVLDLYKYQLLEEKVNDLNSNLTAKFSKFIGNLSYQKIKLRRSLEKLEKIASGAETFRKLLKMQNESSSATHDSNDGHQPDFTDSIPPLKVFGRDKERHDIIDKYLLDTSEASEPESEKCYSVVAILGIGGVGKTTLAQQVYNDKSLYNGKSLEKNFDIKMWVCVSRRLDVLKHTKEMIESASGHKCPRLENGEVLKRKLIDLIKLKKVLLILDDVWFENSEDEQKWENLLAPLAKAGNRGSRILVTTRRRNLPQALHPRYSMMLQDLEEDAILSLFNHHAFYEVNLNNSYLQVQLENIGKKIVQNLHRSPLAAKAVGYRLRQRLEVKYWREILEGENLCDAWGALLWSYQRLDAPLQHCFSYFSLFPKGTSYYNSEEMIRMWIAEGFINSSNDSRRMEDIGIYYFDELVAGSFLQLVKSDYNRTYYNMHDLFHDLAENISKEDCLRIEDEHGEEIPQTIRHLYVLDESLKENSTSLQKLKKLHTLIINVSHASSTIDHIFAAAIKKCKKLRVLRINGVTGIETLPESIGDLKHLHYLDLYWNNKLVELPASLGKLYHLQILSLPRGANLPRSLKNLINLQHLKKDYEALALPYIGRLTSLQALKQFDVKKEKGYDIGQLKNLNEIRDRLTISYLENVEGNNRAAEASLQNKRHLESLSLEWDNYDDDSECRRDLDVEVLKGLQPHPNLTDLTIRGYMSCGYPNWLLQEGCLQNLGSLYFHNCTWLEVLPDMKKLFPCCHKLEIWCLPNLKKFPLLPQSLKILEISECPSLVFVLKEELQEGREDIFPGQEKIELILPSLLEELKIESCDITDRALSQLLRSLASLKCLELEEIKTITALPSEEILQHLISLTQLQIICCSQLKSLGGLYVLPSLETLDIRRVTSWEFEILASGEGGGRGILPPSLRSLYICGCTTMKSFDIGDIPNLNYLWLIDIPSLASLSMSRLTALTNLMIFGCPLLSSLPSNLPDSFIYLCLDSCSGILSLPENLPKSLDILNLKNCPGILSLPDLPQSLKMILISGCPALEKRCRSPDCEEWPKIAHIPKRYRQC